MLPIHWRALRPSNAPPRSPQPSEREQRPILAEREPFRRPARLRCPQYCGTKSPARCSGYACRATRANAAETADVANVGDRRAAELRRPWRVPQRAHNQLALAVSSIANGSEPFGREALYPQEQRQAVPYRSLARAGTSRGSRLGLLCAMRLHIFDVLSGGQSLSTSRVNAIPSASPAAAYAQGQAGISTPCVI